MDRIIEIIWGVLFDSWVILNESAIYVLIGFTIAALIRAFVPDEFVARHLGGKGAGPVLKAALIGIPLPLCSCGVIPAAMSLRRQGASRGATSAFLVSTPETGVDSIAITWALLDPIMTVFRPIAAFITAMVAGFLENRFGRDSAEIVFIDCKSEACRGTFDCPAQTENIPWKKRATDSFKFAFIELLSDIGKWLLIGILLAGAISYAVPDNYFEQRLGTGFMSYLIMLILGVPLYICASSSTPLAAAMVLKGLSPGAALIFLLSGPATNIATITLIGKMLGKRALTIYLISIVVCSLLLGWMLDYLYIMLGIQIVPSIAEFKPESISCINFSSSVVLLGLIGWNILRRYLSGVQHAAGMER